MTVTLARADGLDLPAERFVPAARARPLDLAAVAAELAKAGLVVDRAAGARQLAGGLANLNYLLRVNGAPAVLRRPPSGPLPPGAHDMAREHRILSRLNDRLPEAPRGLHFCADTGAIGVPFQLIEFRDGLTVRGDALPPQLQTPAARRALSVRLIEMLARIHAVDAAAAGLGDLGKPDGFFARAVEGWARRADAVVTGGSGRATAHGIVDWLRQQRVGASDPTLLHCDFKLDNCILAPASLDIVAVVDWDMGTRGDPLFDLATTLSYWTQADDPPCLHRLAQMPTAAPGFLTRAEATALYATLTGRDLADLPAFRVLALFKLAVVFLQLYERWTSGAIVDARYADFAPLGAELMEYAAAVMGEGGR